MSTRDLEILKAWGRMAADLLSANRERLRGAPREYHSTRRLGELLRAQERALFPYGLRVRAEETTE